MSAAGRLLRGLGLELAWLAAGYLPLALIARAVVLIAHGQGDSADAVSAAVWNPAFYIEDILSFCWFALIALTIGACIPRARVGLRQAILAGLLFLAGAAYIAGTNYFATYDVPFGWHHLQRWEGTGEMLTSIRAETPAAAVYALILLVLLAPAWAFFSARFLRAAHSPEAVARDHEESAIWPGALRLGLVALLLLPVPCMGLAYQSAEGAAHASALDHEAAQAAEIRAALGKNQLSYLLFSIGQKQDAGYDLIMPDGTRFVSRRPFRYRFETDSLSWRRSQPAEALRVLDSPDSDAITPAERAAALARLQNTLPPVRLAAGKQRYNVVLYFFESTAAQYLAETVEAYPETAPRTMLELRALADPDGPAAEELREYKAKLLAEAAAAADEDAESEAEDSSDADETLAAGDESGAADIETGAGEDEREEEELSVAPVWERLAENSLVLLKHYVQAPLSINSLFTILTSAYALPADRWAATDYPDIALTSLPQILRQQGYATGIFHTGTYHYAGQGDFLKHRSFDVMHDAKQLRKEPFTEEINWGIDDRALIDPSVKFAQRARGQGQPFFLVGMPGAPHHPYEVPEDAFKIYEIDPETDGFPNRWKRAFAKYKNSLYYSDYVLGEYIKAFEEAGLADNTIFLIFADHGEAFGQHRGNSNHPFFVYEENVHVPFLLYNERLFPESIEHNNITRHTDILPTVLDLLGLSALADEKHEGRSILAGGPPQMATFYTSWRNQLTGLRDDRWKYIYNLKTGQDELYDLRRDPREYQNLAAGDQEERRQLYRTYLFEQIVYQRQYFEKVLGRSVDWSATQEKDEGPIVRPDKQPADSAENASPADGADSSEP